MQASLRSTLFLLLFFPTVALGAQGVPAGFAPTSVFASKTAPVAGETISLFTVLYNSSSESLSGDVVFTIDGKNVGTKHFTLGSGETQTPAITWKAVEGSHVGSAHFESVVATDADVSLLNDKADSITITVATPPPPTPTQQAVQTATNIATQAAPVVNNIFNSLEYLRDNAVHTLENQLAAAPSSASTDPFQQQVLGTSTVNSATPVKDGLFGGIWHSILRALLFVCQIKYLFYFVLLFALYCVYKLVQMFFRGARAY